MHRASRRPIAARVQSAGRIRLNVQQIRAYIQDHEKLQKDLEQGNALFE